MVNTQAPTSSHRLQKTPSSSISKWQCLYPYLKTVPPTLLNLYCAVVGFFLYFCFYAFNRPYLVISLDKIPPWLGYIDYKVALLLFHGMGYIASKFVGIKFVVEAQRRGMQRCWYLMALGILSQLSLVLFGLLPLPYKVVGVFLNGIPLGMVWGFIMTYLEGRQGSDFMYAVTSSSYIVATAAVKDIGLSLLISWKVDPFWMPATVGALFLIPYCLFTLLLAQIPLPKRPDVDAKMIRKPMSHKQRMAYLHEYWPGLVTANIAHFFLCGYKTFRDTFGREISESMGATVEAGMFVRTEMSVGVAVSIVMGALVLIKSNYTGFLINFLLCFFGFIMCSVSFIIYDQFHISYPALMILTGLATYFAYAPFGSTFYERKIAYLKTENVTVAFPVQLGGAIGSLGSCIIFTAANLSGTSFATTQERNHSRMEFYRYFSYFISIISGFMTLLTGLYFLVYKPRQVRIRQQEYANWVMDRAMFKF